MVLRYNLDLPITFLVTALLALLVNWRGGWSQRICGWWPAEPCWCWCSGCDVVPARHAAGGSELLWQPARPASRCYPGATVRTLTNGSIQHGTQIFTPELRDTHDLLCRGLRRGPGPACCCQGRARNIGVIGLGVGTIAAYGKPGDRIRFYEINPAVAPIARNLFSYIRESGAQVSIVEGDARTSLASETPQNFDVLVVDAFSGDAIPLHLLTAEAIALYKRNLVPGGILAFHISNQHVDLEPEIALLAKSAGMQAMKRTSLENDPRGEFTATWILATDNGAFFDLPDVAAHLKSPVENPKVRLWTDDYSSLLPILRW